MTTNLIKVSSLTDNKMTSLQIAELTGKRHSNVIRDIDCILNQGVNKLNFESVDYKDKKGETRRCYNLTKKGCLILASGYSALLREKIINRWEELENQQHSQFAIPQTYSEALMLAANQAQQLEEQQKQIASQQSEIKAKKVIIECQKPFAELGDAVMKYDTDITIEELANILCQNGYDTGGRRLRQTLREQGYLRLNNNPSQKAMNQELLAVTKKSCELPNGTTKIYNVTMVTSKGQSFFVNKFKVKPIFK